MRSRLDIAHVALIFGNEFRTDHPWHAIIQQNQVRCNGSRHKSAKRLQGTVELYYLLKTSVRLKGQALQIEIRTAVINNNCCQTCGLRFPKVVVCLFECFRINVVQGTRALGSEKVSVH